MRKLRPWEAGQLAQVMQLLCLFLGPWGRVLIHLGACPHSGGVSSPTRGQAHLSLLTLPSQIDRGPGFRGHQWGVYGRPLGWLMWGRGLQQDLSVPHAGRTLD